MRNDRSVAASRSPLVLALVAAAALALAMPAAAPAQEVAHGVKVLLPPSYAASQEPPAGDRHPPGVAPSQGLTDSQSAPRVIVVTAAPPPVPGWQRLPEIEVVGLDYVGEVIVYSPAPQPMPGWRKLRGVDIEYHRIAEARAPSRITTHSWKPDASTQIRYHDWRSANGGGIPYARSGEGLVAQSWNPYGARFEAPRIRYHGWPRGSGDGR